MHDRKLFTSIHGCVITTGPGHVHRAARRAALLSTLNTETPGKRDGHPRRVPTYIHTYVLCAPSHHRRSRPPPLLRPALRLLGRLALLTHFLAELYSKAVDPGFAHWTAVIGDAGMPAPAAELVLVIALLLVGTALVLLGTRRALPVGVGALVVFQVPTAVLFESGSYERCKSASLVCALLYFAATAAAQPATPQQRGETCDADADHEHPPRAAALDARLLLSTVSSSDACSSRTANHSLQVTPT